MKTKSDALISKMKGYKVSKAQRRTETLPFLKKLEKKEEAGKKPNPYGTREERMKKFINWKSSL